MNPNSNYGWGLPVQASTYAAKIDYCLAVVHVMMFVVFALWAVFFVYCLVAYRQKANPTGFYSHHSGWKSYVPDILIFIFEIWLIFFVGVPIWAHIREAIPKPEDATQVDIVAQQFTWNIHYPGPDGKFGKTSPELASIHNPVGLDAQDPDAKDDVVMENELYLPVGKPVRLNLTSKDVIHSFFIPEFRSKQDVVPGMKIPIWFEPSKTGHFEIGCAQLCGTGHYVMRGDVYVKTQAEFDAWLAQQIQNKAQ